MFLAGVIKVSNPKQTEENYLDFDDIEDEMLLHDAELLLCPVGVTHLDADESVKIEFTWHVGT